MDDSWRNDEAEMSALFGTIPSLFAVTEHKSLPDTLH